MQGSHYINGKLPEGTSLITWEEQWGLFLKFKKKIQENKENTRCTWQSLIILSVIGLLLLAADTQFTDIFHYFCFHYKNRLAKETPLGNFKLSLSASSLRNQNLTIPPFFLLNFVSSVPSLLSNSMKSTLRKGRCKMCKYSYLRKSNRKQILIDLHCCLL